MPVWCRLLTVARFRLGAFNQVQVLDLTATDADLNGFQQGFSDGPYEYRAPNHNGARCGKVARFSRGASKCRFWTLQLLIPI